MKPYEIFEHTADVGVRIFGKDLPDVFRNAALGFYDLMTDVEVFRKSIRGGLPENMQELTIHLRAEKADDLLLKWLRELLFLFGSARLIFTEFEFAKMTEHEIQVNAKGLRYDPMRHVQKCEVKAVTYHHFKLEKQNAGWVAEVIFDI